ncbi:glycosyltransferase family 39 protein [Clavulina sp. PMI_390]|nr:glycosyltransferase family 39 protein [Clavulina sp. PMI_390]
MPAGTSSAPRNRSNRTQNQNQLPSLNPHSSASANEDLSYHQVDISLSPTSSYEEISYKQFEPSSSSSSHYSNAASRRLPQTYSDELITTSPNKRSTRIPRLLSRCTIVPWSQQREQMALPRAGEPPITNTKVPKRINQWAPLFYTLASIWTRIYRIGLAPTVVWDEAHFGKFASHYLKREFYFDVHPPLGKMLVALVGLLSGYDGSYDFKSGEAYPDNVPFTSMRIMLAMFGAAMVPLGWYTAKELHLSWRARHLITLMVLFDNAWLTISKFILLDSLLLFFTCTTIYTLALFHNQQYRSFSPEWWLSLSLTGISIGCVMSVKWVGFFAMATVGLYTIEDLWEKFGDLKMPVTTYIRHWIARGLCLIVLPLIVYMISFKLHFLILNHSGPGDAQMSSLFQANLEGNDFMRNPLEVAFGSQITLKNVGYGGGLLHSHVQAFPTGSLQQQVTCYHYKDENNMWSVLPMWDEPKLDLNSPTIRWLKDRETIRLQHVPTTRMLHSHPVAAPVTKLENEVSCYGNDTIGDVNDHWIVHIVQDAGQKLKKDGSDVVRSLTTRIRFQHRVLGCWLKANNVILPQWGFKQTEVSCDPENEPGNPHTQWNVETHVNDRLPPGKPNQYASPFLSDFWHLNVAMMTSNNALVPDPDKYDILASAPLDWPFLNVGLRMCGWGDHQAKYYLLGNPIVWWGSTASLFGALLVFVVYLIRWQRKFNDLGPEEWQQLLHPGKIALFGWLLHFIPFLIMGRVTYIHHYLPTLWFAVLMTGHVLDQLVFADRRKFKEVTKNVVFGLCAFAVVGTFWWFRKISFGIEGPVGEQKGWQWRRNWNIY